jgi:hypothetical protein
MVTLTVGTAVGVLADRPVASVAVEVVAISLRQRLALAGGPFRINGSLTASFVPKALDSVRLPWDLREVREGGMICLKLAKELIVVEKCRPRELGEPCNSVGVRPEAKDRIRIKEREGSSEKGEYLGPFLKQQGRGVVLILDLDLPKFVKRNESHSLELGFNVRGNLHQDRNKGPRGRQCRLRQ